MKKIHWLILLLTIGFVFILYSFNLKQSLFYHPDFARDMHEILKISQGDLVLLGPKLTFGGLYLGPYYFYLFVPAYLIGGKEILSVHYFNLFLFVIALGYFFKKASTKFGTITGLFATLTLSLLPLFLIGSRNPSNAYSFIPLFSILLTYIYFNREKRSLFLFILGFLFGTIINFHYLNVVFLPALIIYFWLYLKDRKKIIIFLAGLALTFLPLILFELKHSFVMFTNTFIDKSYLKWLNKENLPAGFEAKENIIANFLFLSDQMRQYLVVNPLILYLITGPMLIFKQVKKEQKVIFISSIFTLFITSSIIRFQFIPHYLFGLSFFLFFNFLIILLSLKKRWLSLLIMFLLMVTEVFFFPKHIYQPSMRTPDRFKQAVDFVIKNQLVNQSNFNVIQITKENLLATLGFEYRYFFRKADYLPDSEYLYSQSKQLIIFSEIPYQDISQFTSWEAEQFGKRYFSSAEKYQRSKLTIYKISKD